jgi:hypothetical protein
MSVFSLQARIELLDYLMNKARQATVYDRKLFELRMEEARAWIKELQDEAAFTPPPIDPCSWCGKLLNGACRCIHGPCARCGVSTNQSFSSTCSACFGAK